MQLMRTAAHERFLADLRGYLDGLDLDLAAVRASFEADPMQIVGPARDFVRRLGRDGWLGMGWPVEHGGGGRSAVEQWLFLEELAYRRLPSGNLTTSSLGPTLARLGTDEQRTALLPGILAGEIDFAVGYTEPEAGTDLAALSTRAVRDGDVYRVTGQKVFTTGAHVATHLWLAARTGTREDRHRGLTLLIVPLPSPGVEIVPIMTQADERTNQVFLTEVEVPVGMRVGAENAGWSAITTQLNFERLFCYSDLRHQFERVLEWARERDRLGRPTVRTALAQLAADLDVCRLFAQRAAWLVDQDQVPVVEASMAKIWYSELRQRLAVTALDLIGPTAQLRGGHPLAPADGILERAYRASTVIKFGAGTNEIQRDLVARRWTASVTELDLGPELNQLRDSARSFLGDHLASAPPGGPSPAWDPKVWAGGLRLGWLGAVLDGGPVAAGAIAGEIGRAALPLPFTPTAGVLSLLVAAGATDEVDRLCDRGSAIVALLEEPVEGAGDALSTGPRVVEWATEAEELWCVRELDEERSVIASVPRDAVGVRVEPVEALDAQPVAVVRMDRVMPAHRWVVPTGAVTRAMDLVRLLRSAELVGGARAVLEMTAGYVSTRRQFGVALSSFQAVGHLLADMAIAVDGALLATGEGLQHAAAGRDSGADRGRSAAVAPYLAGRAYLRAVTDGAQLHGGIGVTTDYPLHRYFLRAQAGRLRLGTGDDQLERIAATLPG